VLRCGQNIGHFGHFLSFCAGKYRSFRLLVHEYGCMAALKDGQSLVARPMKRWEIDVSIPRKTVLISLIRLPAAG
jgi:hypothetical protein